MLYFLVFRIPDDERNPNTQISVIVGDVTKQMLNCCSVIEHLPAFILCDPIKRTVFIPSEL
jgi:hypothetical protein